MGILALILIGGPIFAIAIAVPIIALKTTTGPRRTVPQEG